MNLYIYHFKDQEKPIQIEALSKMEASGKLEEILCMPRIIEKGYDINKLVNQTVETLISGVSSKTVGGQAMVWNDESGWINK
jgi:hypothetical protein